MIIDAVLVEEVAGAVTAVGGVIHVVQRIFANLKTKKEEYKRSILKQAKAEAEAVRIDLEAQIKALEKELENQKLNVSKDFSHLRETYNAEIKALGEKIANLHLDLTNQHQSLVVLLTQLVNRK